MSVYIFLFYGWGWPTIKKLGILFVYVIYLSRHILQDTNWKDTVLWNEDAGLAGKSSLSYSEGVYSVSRLS
jgi:hypothetical protein